MMRRTLISELLQNLGKPVAVAMVTASGLAACGTAVADQGINDPYEQTNRAMHSVNVGLDRALVKPTSKVYGTIVPQPVKTGVANFASNLSLPGDVVNSALQGNGEASVRNTFRFLINSTLGVGGLFDPAKDFGLAQKKTDFGETLYVWGVGEGPYLEFPGLGPSTVRDAVGTAVDFAANPVSIVLPKPESYYATASKVGSKLGDRDRYSETIDSVLYDSADSYAQTRLLYLQNRRFELGQPASSDGDDFIDPYQE